MVVNNIKNSNCSINKLFYRQYQIYCHYQHWPLKIGNHSLCPVRKVYSLVHIKGQILQYNTQTLIELGTRVMTTDKTNQLKYCIISHTNLHKAVHLPKIIRKYILNILCKVFLYVVRTVFLRICASNVFSPLLFANSAAVSSFLAFSSKTCSYLFRNVFTR